MRKDLSHIEQYRDDSPGMLNHWQKLMGSGCDFIGSYTMPLKCSRVTWGVLVSIDGGEWEHVSITPMTADRLPRWVEMCEIKDLFWHDDEYVLQFHPRKADYVNMHPKCLHLWKNRKYPQRVPDRSGGKAYDRED